MIHKNILLVDMSICVYLFYFIFESAKFIDITLHQDA